MTLLRTIILAALIGPACANAQDAPKPAPIESETQSALFHGVWENDRGSQVNFIEAAGHLSGYYQTSVGQPDKSQKFPLTGFTQGDQITFTVNFGAYGSMTSWTGQMSEDASGAYIKTLWHLTRDVPDAKEDDDMWKSITAGASTFRRAAPAQ